MFVYLSDQVLDQAVDEIHEQEVGQAVFGRPCDYDTLADNTVRVHASTLRKRVKQYFENEGSSEPLIIEIPRGNYAPVFLERPVEVKPVPVPEPAPEPATPAELAAPTTTPKRSIPVWVPSSIAAIAVLLLIFVLYTHNDARALERPPSPAVAAVWAQIFPKDRQTDLVLGDAALGDVQEETSQQVQLAAYFDRSYLTDPNRTSSGKIDPNFAKSLLLKRQVRYGDVPMLMRLTGIAQSVHGNAQVRFARDYSFRDLKTNNAVLFGHILSNPWLEPFLSHVTLQWKFDAKNGSYYPVDTTDSNAAKYDLDSAPNSPHQVFATLTLLPNLGKTGNVLILSATGGAAVTAAVDFLSDEHLLKELRNQLAPKSSATDPLPYFEVLIRSGGGTSLPRDTSIVVARRVLP
jgi:hypothetical protein